MEALLEHRMFSLITPGLILYLLIIIIIIILAMPQGMQDLSSSTRGWTHAPCIGKTEC